MTSTLPIPTCPNPMCETPHVIRNGSHNGRRRYHCRGCGRFFGETEGTPMYGLHTEVSEVAHALLIVMRRGKKVGDLAVGNLEIADIVHLIVAG